MWKRRVLSAQRGRESLVQNEASDEMHLHDVENTHINEDVTQIDSR